MPKKTKKDHPPIASLYDELGSLAVQLLQHPDCPVWLYNSLGDVMLEAMNASSGEFRDLQQALSFGVFARHAEDRPERERRDFARAYAILILQGGAR